MSLVETRGPQIFPVLTPHQAESAVRFASAPPHSFAPGEVIYDVGSLHPPMWLVQTGALELERRDGLAHHSRIAMLGPGQFTGEVGHLSGHAALAVARAGPEGCTALPFDASHVRALIVGSAEIGEIVMRAFILRRVALMTERIRRNDAFPGVNPQPEDMLEDATLGGARAVRQPRTGSLEVGKKADLIVLDTQRVHLVPRLRIISAWIHNGQPSDVESVMVDGEFVMRDRKILTVDEAAIVAEADKVGRRVWAKVQESGAVKVPGRA